MVIVIASLFVDTLLKKKLKETIKREIQKKFEKHHCYVDYHWNGNIK